MTVAATKNVWVAATPHISDQWLDLQWLADNGWGVNLETPLSSFASVAAFRIALEPALTLMQAYGIPASLHVAQVLESGTIDTLASEYDTNFNAVFTDLEDRWGPGGTQGDVFTTYWYEGGWDNAAYWLRNFTPLEIRMGIWGSMWVIVGWAGSYISDIDLRVEQVDGIDLEMFYMDDLHIFNMVACGQYLKTKYPSLSLGIDTMPFYPPWVNATTRIWTHRTGFDDAPPSIEESKKRCITYTALLKESLGKPFDVLQVEISGADDTHSISDATTPTFNDFVQEQMEYLLRANLTGTGTKYTQELGQTGITPLYGDASLCVHDPSLSDTFENTGNELILLKNYVDNCAVHNITVTSTDTLTHEDYTITCLPERGTIIGPYPLDDYGALPTITYNNTNLYVSILKVVPYANQT